MEDDNGLELSLGLSCGGSSGKSKPRDVSSDPKVEEGSSDRSMGSNMTVSDPSFKNFFQTGIDNQDHKGKQKSDTVSQQHENFWTDLGKCSAPLADCSNGVPSNLSQFNRQDLWASNNKRIDTTEEKLGPSKRKMPFEEINFHNKHEKVADYAEAHSKNPTSVNLVRNSRVSITTEDDSSGGNEDVAESEAEGSNSWLVSHCEGNSKCSDIPKFNDKHVVSDSTGIASQGQPSVSGNESGAELGKVAYGIPLSLQPLTVMPVPYPVPVKVPGATSGPNATGFSPPCVMQLMNFVNSERPMVQPMNSSHLQLAFGYSSLQLPTLETGSSWAFCSQPRNITSFASKDHAGGAPKSEHSEDDVKTSLVSVQAPHNVSATLAYEGKPSESTKGSGKHTREAGTSASQTEDEGKGNHTNFRPKEIANLPIVEGFSHEGSSIRPGVSPNVKFGGCGSYPDLPWVSTTGSGPNGKTISGVTYKYNQNQIKVVCACHGTHMSPEEFVQHASSADDAAPNPSEDHTALASLPSSNPAASAKR